MFRNTVRVYFLRVERNFSQNRQNSNVAFLGCGQMGARMVNNLIKHGKKPKIYDVVPSAIQNIQGATPCSTPEETVEGADIIITMLPNGQIVKDTIMGDKGVLKNIRKNALLLDCSTTGPQVARKLNEAAQAANVRFLDAPVSGGVVGAQAGTLCFMVGGNEKDCKEVEPVLLHMGSKVHFCGASGAGQITKLCNNLILGVTMIGTCEAMNLGIKLGLDPKLLTDVVNVSTGRSWSSDTYNPVPGVMENVPAARDYEGGFSCELIAKDLGLAGDAALSINAPVPLTALTHQIFRTLMTYNLGKKDFSVVYKYFKGEALKNN
ncbi:NAD-dependent L-serine dehydrogenase [Anthonomus grandis grandis]|uniref:NAD-dependent L-serine dehydrogenase n=1 Tax=Anthonomus grandis grandis TaxID=2921223 RepID=UPI00216615E7|nr:NAD-dependent L-serine dehydrogenase [Anthonomus grandis grandis]